MSSVNTQDQGSFTRGSQIFAHQFRMFGQGSINVLVVGLVFAVIWLIIRISQKLYFISLYYYLIERYVQLKLAIGEHFYQLSEIGIKFYYLEQQKWAYRNAEEFVYKFWNVTPHGSRILILAQWLISTALLEVFIVFTVTAIATAIFFKHRGSLIKDNNKLRGMDFMPSNLLAKLLVKERKASSIKIAGLPLVKDSERQHILITGTTSTGKTNMLNELLPQIRSKNDRAIIVDVTGAYVDKFYDASRDKILNPFDKRTQNWLPWNDCLEISDFDSIASSFTTNSFGNKESFFDRSAELVLAEGLKIFKKNKDIKKLLDTIIYSSNKEFAAMFNGTAVAGIVSGAAPETSTGIQATLSKNITALKHLVPNGNFSIRKWFEDPAEQGWLFITASPDQRTTLRPLISAWISIAIKALMKRSPIASNDNMWFILDELPALQKVNSLDTALAESRKYGGCFVAGIQNISQMEMIYGHAGASSMLDLFNSKFIFRVGDQQTAHRSAMMLGEQELNKTQESLSYGSNTIRDGVNINIVEKKTMLVMPSEIMSLPNLSCFVKLSGHYPVTKLKMKFQG